MDPSHVISIVPPTTDAHGDPLKSDPAGLAGAPYVLPGDPQRMKNVVLPENFSPKGHLWVAITTYNPPYQFHALDSNGYWFHGQAGVSGGALYDSDYPGADDRSWFDKAVDAVGAAIETYGIPILAAALAAAAPGVGTAAGVGLLAWKNLAQGRSLSDALIDAEKASLSKTPSELTAFQAGLDQAKAGLTTENLLAFAEKNIPAGLDAAKKAFFTAVQIQRAQQTQDLLTSALKYYLVHSPAVNATHTGSDWDGGTLDHAMQWGSDLGSVMLGLRGVSGVAMLQSLAAQAAALVQAHETRPDLLKIIADHPDQADKHFSFAATAAPAGGGATSSGPGLGTLALTAGGIYAAFKWVLPHALAHFAHPGTRPRRGRR